MDDIRWSKIKSQHYVATLPCDSTGKYSVDDTH